MGDLSNAKLLLSTLNTKLENEEFDEAKKLVTKLKILMLDFPVDESPECRNLATAIMEKAVLISIEEGDLAGFARNISQVVRYGRPSTKILGLHQMYLLTENRLSEFHSELELLSEAEADDPLVAFPISLERSLMMGSYDEVIAASSSVPDASYGLFTENLKQTVRDSIADCLEAAYPSLSMVDAASMMKFDTVAELEEYIEDCRDDWIVENGEICFQPPDRGGKASDIPSKKLMKQVLSYATELERIV